MSTNVGDWRKKRTEGRRTRIVDVPPKVREKASTLPSPRRRAFDTAWEGILQLPFAPPSQRDGVRLFGSAVNSSEELILEVKWVIFTQSLEHGEVTDYFILDPSKPIRFSEERYI